MVLVIKIVSKKSLGVKLMFDISNELSTKTIKRLYYYSVTVSLFKKTSFKYSQRLIEVLPAIIRTVQNSIEKV